MQRLQQQRRRLRLQLRLRQSLRLPEGEGVLGAEVAIQRFIGSQAVLKSLSQEPFPDRKMKGQNFAAPRRPRRGPANRIRP
jgi:hypothetical protein